MRSCVLVGNQTLASPELGSDPGAAGGRPGVISGGGPATPVGRAITWDENETRAVASTRLALVLDRPREAGAECRGEVGCRDPVEAAEDALRDRQVDEVVLSTLPPGISSWLGQDVPSWLKGAVPVPATVVTSAWAPVPTA